MLTHLWQEKRKQRKEGQLREMLRVKLSAKRWPRVLECVSMSVEEHAVYLSISSGFPTHAGLSTYDASSKSYEYNFSKSSIEQAF